MHKMTLATYIHRQLHELDGKTEPGPYITLSRQPGCEGYKVGELLLETLNKHDPQQRWRLYKKEILQQLAHDSELAEDIIDRERRAAPSILRDFFRGVGKGGVPDGYEIRSKITNMVRLVAYQGYAIIIGQGGTAATADIRNGISVRLEAPMQWRTSRVCTRDNLSKEEAIAKIHAEEAQRAHLRKIYEESNPRSPTFNLTIDNSVLTAEQIASLIHHAIQLKEMLI